MKTGPNLPILFYGTAEEAFVFRRKVYSLALEGGTRKLLQRVVVRYKDSPLPLVPEEVHVNHGLYGGRTAPRRAVTMRE